MRRQIRSALCAALISGPAAAENYHDPTTGQALPCTDDAAGYASLANGVHMLIIDAPNYGPLKRGAMRIDSASQARGDDPSPEACAATVVYCVEGALSKGSVRFFETTGEHAMGLGARFEGGAVDAAYTRMQIFGDYKIGFYGGHGTAERAHGVFFAEMVFTSDTDYADKLGTCAAMAPFAAE